MIFAKTNLVSHIKCGTNETRMEKRTIWCIICICPINSKHFEFVWVALLTGVFKIQFFSQKPKIDFVGKLNGFL